jgi:hypothetical protein
MDQRPGTFGACYRRGVLVHELLHQYHLRRRDEDEAAHRLRRDRRNAENQSSMAFLIDGGMFFGGNQVEEPCALPRIRRLKARHMTMTLPNGKKCAYVPTMSLWYILYICDPEVDCHRFLQTFRVRFRLPYESFLEIVERMKPLPEFQRWQ